MSRTSPRFGHTVRVGDFRIESHYLRFIADELRRYPERKDSLRELEAGVIKGTSELDTLGMPRGSGPSNPTHAAALRLMDVNEPTFKRRVHLRTLVASVDEWFRRLPDEQRQIVRHLYWEGHLTMLGVASRLHISLPTLNRTRNHILATMAVHLIGDHILIAVVNDDSKCQ